MRFHFAMAPMTIVTVFLSKLIHDFLFSELYILPGNAALVEVLLWMIFMRKEKFRLYWSHLKLPCLKVYYVTVYVGTVTLILKCTSIHLSIYCTSIYCTSVQYLIYIGIGTLILNYMYINYISC